MWREVLRLSISLAYKKDLQLAEARGRNLMLLETPLSILLEGLPLPPQYKDHPLKGDWKEHREFHLQGDWVVIYRVENHNTLVLVRTGTHSDLFNK